jgi:single-strand DNA-binding protein
LKVEDGTKREEVTFVPITLWKRLGEIALEYLKKASPVFIEGWLELDAWQDKQSGQKQSPLRVVARNVQLLGRRPDFATSAPAPGPEASYVTGANLTVDGGMNA